MFSNKDPSEIVLVTFDFTNVTTTVASPTVAATVAYGTDGNPSAILSGAATVVGTTVTQLITGGLNGVSYKLECTITGGSGTKFVLADTMPVVSV